MSKILLTSLSNSFNSRTIINSLVYLNFLFVTVVVVVVVVIVNVVAHQLYINCIEFFFQYFFQVSLKYLKTYGNGLNLSIIHYWLVTHVFQLCFYIHMFLS